MTELYYTSPYQKELITEIIAIKEKDGTYHIVLENTIFYPGNDEMPCDLGFIEDSPITSVYMENETIYHVSPKKPIKIHKARCQINWPRRLHYMQQHTASHLVSTYLSTHFNVETLNYKLGETYASLTLSAVLLPEQVATLEKDLNQQISDHLTLSSCLPTKQELKKLGFKKALPKTASPLRILQIDDLNPIPCSGLTLASTLDLQLIKITDVQKSKNDFTLSFLAGQVAVNHLLNTKDETTSHIQGLTKECHKLSSEVQNLKGIVDTYRAKELVEAAPTIGSYRIIKAIYENMEPKTLQSFANRIVSLPNVIVLLGLKVEKSAYLFFMCSKDQKKISMNQLLKDSITLIDGQGGGTDFSAQGGGKSASNLESALDYALSQIQNKF